MWRALSVARGDLVVYLDSDTREFSAPLRHRPARAARSRASRSTSSRAPSRGRSPPRPASALPGDGGRVTELTARPLLSAFYPELAGFGQPLAGEVAGRRDAVRARSRSRPATRSRWRCCSTSATRWAWSGWPQVDLGRAAQLPPAAAGSSGRWPTPCCAWCSSGCAATAACSTTRRRRSRPPTAAWSRSSSSSARRHVRSAALACGDPLRLHRPRRHPARPRRVAVPRRRGRLHAAPRPRARGLPPGGGGGGDQVRPPPRPGDGGRPPARPDVVHLRGRDGHGDRRRADLPHRRPPAARRTLTIHAQVERVGRARRCCSSAYAGRLEHHDAVARRPRGLAPVPRRGRRRRGQRAARARGPRQPAPGRQRRDRRRPPRLPPDPGGRLEGARRSRPTCARAATRARSASRSATRARTWTSPPRSGRFFLVANADAEAARRGGAATPTSTVTEAAMGEGFYEAVVRALAERNQLVTIATIGCTMGVGLHRGAPDKGGSNDRPFKRPPLPQDGRGLLHGLRAAAAAGRAGDPPRDGHRGELDDRGGGRRSGRVVRRRICSLLVSLVLAVPAVLGLMHMLREREVALGHVGGGLGLLGILAFVGHRRDGRASSAGRPGRATQRDGRPVRPALRQRPAS